MKAQQDQVRRKNSTANFTRGTSVDFGADSTSFGAGEEVRVRIEEETQGIINLIKPGPKTRNRPMTANLVGRN